MQNHLDRSGLTLKLKELNVSEHSLDQLATDAMLQTRLLQNNPRELEWQQAREIYQAIYS
jgi:alcohol dehydrogenase